MAYLENSYALEEIEEAGLYNLKDSIKDKCLVQVLHTLVSIMPDDQNIDTEFGKGQYGYSSVGRIIAVGERVSRVEAGQYVLLPPIYGKYFLLDVTDIFWGENVHIRLLPHEVDIVDALFAPIFCVALKLLEEFEEICEKEKKAFLVGHTLMSEAIYRILGINEIPVFIINDKKYVESKRNIYPDANLDDSDPNKSVKVIFCGWTPQAFEVRRKLENLDIQWEEIPDIFSVFTKYVNRDLFTDVMNCLTKCDEVLKGLIAQHVHAECADQICDVVELCAVHGPSVVYDW